MVVRTEVHVGFCTRVHESAVGAGKHTCFSKGSGDGFELHITWQQGSGSRLGPEPLRKNRLLKLPNERVILNRMSHFKYVKIYDKL